MFGDDPDPSVTTERLGSGQGSRRGTRGGEGSIGKGLGLRGGWMGLGEDGPAWLGCSEMGFSV